MKLVSYLLMAFGFVFLLSCSNNTDVKDVTENTAGQVAEHVTANVKEDLKVTETKPQEKQTLASGRDIKPEALTAEGFREKIWDYKTNPEAWTYKGELPCVVDFYADWCKPCKMVAPIMDDLADYYEGRVVIYKVNTDQQRELATVFQVTSIPAILFAPVEGKPAMQPGAMQKEDYIKIIDEFILKTNENKNKQS